MNIIFAVIAAIAILFAGLCLRALIFERRKVDDLTLALEQNKVKLTATERYWMHRSEELREDVASAWAHARGVERFCNERVEDLNTALRGSYSLIEMFLEKFEGLEDEIHLNRNEARRLFVV